MADHIFASSIARKASISNKDFGWNDPEGYPTQTMSDENRLIANNSNDEASPVFLSVNVPVAGTQEYLGLWRQAWYDGIQSVASGRWLGFDNRRGQLISVKHQIEAVSWRWDPWYPFLPLPVWLPQCVSPNSNTVHRVWLHDGRPWSRVHPERVLCVCVWVE